MYGIKWFKGANYYQVRGYLMNNGFKRGAYGYYDKVPTKGWVEFEDGIEKIRLECTLKRNDKGTLVCDKVYAFTNIINDNINIDSSMNALLESIKQKIRKNIKGK